MNLLMRFLLNGWKLDTAEDPVLVGHGRDKVPYVRIIERAPKSTIVAVAPVEYDNIVKMYERMYHV